MLAEVEFSTCSARSTGSWLRSIRLSNQQDPEALTWKEANVLVMAEEDSSAGGGLVELCVHPSVRSIDASQSRLRLPGYDNKRGNKGLEGLAYDDGREVFYAVQEGEPQRVMAISARNGTQRDLPGFAPSDLPNLLQLDDLSGLYFANVTQELFFVSHQSRAVVKTSLSGQVLQRLQLKRPPKASEYSPEGIAFTPNGETMFIIAEPDWISIYQADGCTQAADERALRDDNR